jgi:hypothetical protein
MADTITPGSQTSENALASFVTKIAAVVTLLGAVAAVLPEGVAGNHYVALAVTAIGAATKVLVSLGYTNARTDLKTAVVNAAQAIDPKDAPLVAAAANAVSPAK